MASKIQIKRGLEVNLPVLSVGEPAFTTDTNNFYIGNGTANINFAKQSNLNILTEKLSDIAISVKDFGAVGDGITDDTEKLNLAFSSSYKNIYIPAGTYLISNSINIPSNKNIFGTGIQSAIKLKENIQIDMLVSSNCENIVFENFKLDGNKNSFADQSLKTTCTQIINCKNVLFNNMYITGSLIEGMYIYNSNDITLNNILAFENGFKQQDASGIHIDTCLNVNVSNIVSKENGFHGLILSSISGANINNVICENNGWDGLRVQYTSNNNNFNNIQSTGNFRGIYFTTDSNHNSCSNSNFNSNLGNGINFNQSNNNFFANVSTCNNSGVGICTVADTDSLTVVNLTNLNNTSGELDLNPNSKIETYITNSEFVANKYILPIATSSILGGVKQGNNIEIDADGIISSNKGNGDYSVAEGDTMAIGDYSHSEGLSGEAIGEASHAEGFTTSAQGNYAHAEGNTTFANGFYSHSEGQETIAEGEASHTEGYQAKAEGNYSHAEGNTTIAYGFNSHAEGDSTLSNGNGSHAEGHNTNAYGFYSHAQGENTTAYGDYSHSEGYDTVASTNVSHAEGDSTLACQGQAYNIVAFNNTNKTITLDDATGLIVNDVVDIRIFDSKALIDIPIKAINGLIITLDTTEMITSSWKHVIKKANSQAAVHAEGYNTLAVAGFSHAEGMYSSASGQAAHSEGYKNIASGNYSHAEGYNTTASGHYSHVEGNSNQSKYLQHVMGQFATISSASNTTYVSTSEAFIIGNGTSTTARGNGFKVLFSGATYADAAYASTGADYAEYFEWLDGNPNNEDRVGYFVTLDGDKIRKANSTDEYILGIVSATPSIIGDNYESWQNKYITDNFGRIQYQNVTIPATYRTIYHQPEYDLHGKLIKEAYSEQVLDMPERIEKQPIYNPDWDPSKEYISRENRQEWSPIGMMGKLLIRDDGTCEVNKFCKPNDDGIATACDITSNIKYRIMKRINDNIVLVLLK
jgi:hypothetical protein